jgi:hypothetical protein
MPATEVQGWHEFFSIYPFTQDREDLRNAMLCLTFNRMNGGKATLDTFLPDYLKEKDTPVVEKPVDQQTSQFSAFKEKYLTVTQRQ